MALHDQELVNEMHKLPKKVRATFCNGITRRFPCLPITIRGSRHDTSSAGRKLRAQKSSQSSTEDSEDLTP
ncbi:hypothetical protein SK128_015135, partial [Halocaridina rubra]